MKPKQARPFVFVNVAMTADGKLAPATRRFEAFGGPRDKQHLLELRATADAVMSGARTVDLDKITMGPGGSRYRALRRRRGLSEYNLRIVVTGTGSVDPDAEVFKHRFSPIVILTTERASKTRLAQLRGLADEVKICGDRQIDFQAAGRWLREKWQIKRLLCEGGGELNAGLFEADLVDEIHLTLCPLILGGRTAPTLADGQGIEKLAEARRFELVSMKRIETGFLLVYRRTCFK